MLTERKFDVLLLHVLTTLPWSKAPEQVKFQQPIYIHQYVMFSENLYTWKPKNPETHKSGQIAPLIILFLSHSLNMLLYLFDFFSSPISGLYFSTSPRPVSLHKTALDFTKFPLMLSYIFLISRATCLSLDYWNV